MPTSSQALILQTANGSLPPIFGRRYWRPRWSQGYPVCNLDMNQSCYVSEIHRRPYDKPPALRRAESAPLLRLDVSTLPELLQVNGIRGSLAYDRMSNLARYKVSTHGPLGAIRERNLTPIRERDMTLSQMDSSNKTWATTREHERFYGHTAGIDYSTRLTNIPDFKRMARLAESGDEKNQTPTVFMQMETKGESAKLVTSNSTQADFFRLVKSETKSDTTENNENVATFRLIKAFASEPGSFQLTPIDTRDVGNFRLVPPPGFASDDFRISQSDTEPGCYTLLHADPYDGTLFNTVKLSATDNKDFRLIQAKIRDSDDRSGNCEPKPIQAWRDTNRQNLGLPHSNKGVVIKRNEHSENYNFFDEILQADEAESCCRTDMFLPDITLYDSKKATALHRPNQPSTETKTNTGRHELEMDSSDNDMDNFRAKYMDKYQEQSVDVYNRLVNLGFRRATNDTEQNNSPLQTNRFTGYSSKSVSSEWRMHNFDQWSRTTEAPVRKSETSMETSFDTRINAPPQTEEGSDIENKMSLLDEVKLKSDYKMWKKKKVKNVRMRRELPPEDPFAVCVSLKDNVLSHGRIKQVIEKETGCPVVSLQFDPVSVHSQEADARSQWILRFTDESICDGLIASGIMIDETKYQVRSFNEVMKEEHDAYKFSQIMKEIKNRKEKMKKLEMGHKNKTRPKKRTTQTQTNNIPMK